MKGVIITILCCLVIMLTVIDVGLYTANRLVIKSYEAKLQQIQVQIKNRDVAVQQFIGQLQATKTIGEVHEILQGIR